MYDWLEGFKRSFSGGAGDAGKPPSDAEITDADYLAFERQLQLAYQARLDSAAAPEDNQQSYGAASEIVRLQRNGDHEDAERPVGGGLRDAGGEK